MCTFEVLVQNKRSSNPSWKIRFEIKSYAELNHNINNSFTGYLRQSGLWSLCFLFKLDATMKMPISYQYSVTIMENFINECYLATCNDHCQNWNKTHIRIFAYSLPCLLQSWRWLAVVKLTTNGTKMMILN